MNHPLPLALYKMVCVVLVLVFLLIGGVQGFAANSEKQNSIVTVKFDHQMHQEKVFSKDGIRCTSCHQVVETNSGQLQLTDVLLKGMGTFKKPLRQICHDCHQGGRSQTAPQTCYTCHDSQDKLVGVRPVSHQNGAWKSQHALQARSESQSCGTCHSNSQCLKCHASRNPVLPQNHSRNYRLFHSVEARMAPQKCDQCHTQLYCSRCHLGGRR